MLLNLKHQRPKFWLAFNTYFSSAEMKDSGLSFSPAARCNDPLISKADSGNDSSDQGKQSSIPETLDLEQGWALCGPSAKTNFYISFGWVSRGAERRIKRLHVIKKPPMNVKII